MEKTARPFRPVLWAAISVIVLIADYFTGPGIQFPIAFAVPVVATSWYRGFRWGMTLAALLPAARIGFECSWTLPPDRLAIAVNYVIRVLVLGGLAYLVHHVAVLSREVKTLRGILPICSNCKKIRTEDGNWKQLEAYLEEHSSADFTHGLCAECAERLYPQYFKGRTDADGPTRSS